MWQFIRASTAAVAGAYRSMPFPEATGFTINGVRNLVGLFDTPKVTPVQQCARDSACQVCPMFNRKLMTCGTPGDVDKWGNTNGCWCYIPLVSKYKRKGCWLVENQDPRAEHYGWRD